MAERGIIRVEIDIEGVLIVQRMMLPPQLYVRNLQRIADGLDRVGA